MMRVRVRLRSLFVATLLLAGLPVVAVGATAARAATGCPAAPYGVSRIAQAPARRSP